MRSYLYADATQFHIRFVYVLSKTVPRLATDTHVHSTPNTITFSVDTSHAKYFHKTYTRIHKEKSLQYFISMTCFKNTVQGFVNLKTRCHDKV